VLPYIIITKDNKDVALIQFMTIRV